MSYRHGRLVKGRGNEVIEDPTKEAARGAWRDDWTEHVNRVVLRLGPAGRDAHAVAHAHALGLIAGGQTSSCTGVPVSVQRVLLVYHLCGVSAPGSIHNVPHASVSHDAATRSIEGGRPTCIPNR